MSIRLIKEFRNKEQNLSSVLQEAKGCPALVDLVVTSMCQLDDEINEVIQDANKDQGSKGKSNNAQKKDKSTGSEIQLVQTKSSKKEGKVEFTQKSIFEAAGEMSKLQVEDNDALENELKNEIKIMKAQLKVMEEAAQFWKDFGPAWEALQKDPSDYAAFKKVMTLLEEECQNDPQAEAMLKEFEAMGKDENSSEINWKNESGWERFWNGESLKDPHYFKTFIMMMNPILQSIAATHTGNPSFFENSLISSQGSFRARISHLFRTIQILMDIVKILEGSGKGSQTAMFDMEALLMDLEQLQINTNTEKSQQQQQISQEAAHHLQDSLVKIKDALKKAEQKQNCGGFVGFWKHLGKLVKDVGESLGRLVLAGVEELAGDHTDAAINMAKDKQLGEDMMANPVLKVLGEIAMVVMIAAAAISGDIALAAIMLAVFVMSVSGGMEKLTGAIESGMEKLGMTKAAAKIFADIAVMFIITVLSAGAGAVEAGASVEGEAALQIGEEGVEMVSIAADDAEEAIEEGLNEPEQGESGEKAKDSRAVQMGKRAISMGAFGLGSTLGSSTLALDILAATAKKDSEALAIILELLQVIVAAVTASIGGCASMAQSSRGSIIKMTEESAAKLTQFASKTALSANAVGAVAGIANGGETIFRGMLTREIKGFEADVTLDEATQSSTDSMIKQTGEELKQMIKVYEELIATAFKAPEEVANAELQALMQG